MKILLDSKLPDCEKFLQTTLDYTIVSLDSLWKNVDPQQQYFIYGSVDFVSRAISLYPSVFRHCWHDQHLFNYNYFSGLYAEYMFNRDQIYLPVAFLSEFLNHYQNPTFFIRSNSGDKKLPGQVLDKNEKYLYQTLMQLYRLHVSDMVVISSEKSITQETRFWIYHNRVVGQSNYSWTVNNYQDIPLSSIDLAELIAKLDYQLAECYVVDIAYCEKQNQSRVLEFNSFHSSGLYDVDLQQLYCAAENAISYSYQH